MTSSVLTVQVWLLNLRPMNRSSYHIGLDEFDASSSTISRHSAVGLKSSTRPNIQNRESSQGKSARRQKHYIQAVVREGRRAAIPIHGCQRPYGFCGIAGDDMPMRQPVRCTCSFGLNQAGECLLSDSFSNQRCSFRLLLSNRDGGAQ